MRSYTVEKENTKFTVLVNEDRPTMAGKKVLTESIFLPDEDLYEGMILGDILMDYNRIKFEYTGCDSNGNHLVEIGSHTVKFDPKIPLTAENIREKFSELYKKSIYRVETEGGRIFYEACNDMPEKAQLYKDLGAKVILEKRYRKNKKESM